MFKYRNIDISRGFTVIELVVSTGVIVVILGMVFVGYPRFKSRSSLSAIAREIGLMVREAQVFGLAVKESGTGNGRITPTRTAYGIHISRQKPKEVILFADVDQAGSHAGTYQSGDGCGTARTECVRRFTLGGPETISDICVIPGGNVGEPSPDICDIPEVNISFLRPDPEAVIVVDTRSQSYNGAKIRLVSGREGGDEKIIRAWITGQISVQ